MFGAGFLGAFWLLRSTVMQLVDVTLPLQGAGEAQAPGSVQMTVDSASTGASKPHVFLPDETGRPTQSPGRGRRADPRPEEDLGIKDATE